MKISIVVAISNNNAIGGKGSLLWKLPQDMKRFKEITYGHHVLMGRKTYESIPEKFRPLTGRVNIVVSRKKEYAPEGCKTVTSVEEGIAFAKNNGESELMIIGGGEIYNQCLIHADVIYLTQVHHDFAEADTFFPDIQLDQWQVVNQQFFTIEGAQQYNYSFLTLVRKAAK